MSLEPYIIGKKLSELFTRYHLVIFILFASLALAAAIFLLFQAVMTASNMPTETDSSLTSFDKKTIDKIKELQDSNNGNAQLVLPSPRTNPFTE